MPTGVNLQGRCIIVTRPAAQTERLCLVIEDAGGTALRLPLLRIQARDCAQPLLEALQHQPHWAIFTSINAVAQALAHTPDDARWPDQIAAVGAATAQALKSAGLPPTFPPAEPFTSENLLQQLSRYPLDGIRVLLVGGEGGRNAIHAGLSERGARVLGIPVYRRVPIRLEKAQLQAALYQADSLLISSGEGLRALQEQCPRALLDRLHALRLVVPSQRVLKMARETGFCAAAAIAKPMSETGIMQALARVQNRE